MGFFLKLLRAQRLSFASYSGVVFYFHSAISDKGGVNAKDTHSQATLKCLEFSVNFQKKIVLLDFRQKNSGPGLDRFNFAF